MTPYSAAMLSATSKAFTAKLVTGGNSSDAMLGPSCPACCRPWVSSGKPATLSGTVSQKRCKFTLFGKTFEGKLAIWLRGPFREYAKKVTPNSRSARHFYESLSLQNYGHPPRVLNYIRDHLCVRFSLTHLLGEGYNGATKRLMKVLNKEREKRALENCKFLAGKLARSVLSSKLRERIELISYKHTLRKNDFACEKFESLLGSGRLTCKVPMSIARANVISEISSLGPCHFNHLPSRSSSFKDAGLDDWNPF